MSDEELRSKVKDIIHQHVVDCFKAAGVAPLVPRHPGPVADAIIPIVRAEQRKRDAAIAVMQASASATIPRRTARLKLPREVYPHEIAREIATAIRKGAE